MIRFTKNTSFTTIENAYLSLGDSSSNSLSLPNSFASDVGLGIEGAIIQFLAAWKRRHPDATLVVSGTSTSNDISNLAAQPYGAAAIYFCKFLRFHSGEIFNQRDARRILLPQIQAMQNWRLRETMGPRGVNLSCYGGAVNEFILPLYSKQDENSLREEGGFRLLTEKILSAFIPLFKENFSSDGITLVSQIIYELFTNTHEHGRVDERDSTYHENIRGILVREIDYRAVINPDKSFSDVPIQRYFSRMSLRQKHHSPIAAEAEQRVSDVYRGISLSKSSVPRKPLRFLEITIYDAGPGLARNWAWRRQQRDMSELTLDEEYEFVKKCFEMHNTTKSGRGSGAGLTGATDYLRRLNALMILRTGRLLLFQDFSSKNNDVLHHWSASSQSMHNTCGTTFTLAIPLGLNKA